jgi:hypothetical protein
MIKLGPCCICRGTRKVRNVLQLHQKAPIAGRGWGCVVCHLPADGAVAVLCDKCFEDFRAKRTSLKEACRGYPAEDGRIPIGELTGSHEHDMSYHAGETETE